MLISVCISVMTGLWSMLSLKYIRLTIIANDRTQGCYFQKKKGHVCWIIALRSIIQKCFDFVSQKDIIFMADDKPQNIPEKLTYFYINW